MCLSKFSTFYAFIKFRLVTSTLRKSVMGINRRCGCSMHQDHFTRVFRFRQARQHDFAQLIINYIRHAQQSAHHTKLFAIFETQTLPFIKNTLTQLTAQWQKRRKEGQRIRIRIWNSNSAVRNHQSRIRTKRYGS